MTNTSFRKHFFIVALIVEPNDACNAKSVEYGNILLRQQGLKTISELAACRKGSGKRYKLTRNNPRNIPILIPSQFLKRLQIKRFIFKMSINAGAVKSTSTIQNSYWKRIDSKSSITECTEGRRQANERSVCIFYSKLFYKN